MRSKPKTHAFAKSLRTGMTPPEMALWMRLKHRAPGLPVFRRQHPFGPYVLDFYCAKARLAVEVDGQSHGMGDQPARDIRRDAYLAREGIRVMRYLASEVMADPNGVANGIFEAAGWAPE
jgi:very-short-patch-repair endonuclease